MRGGDELRWFVEGGLFKDCNEVGKVIIDIDKDLKIRI